jgi:ferredoxin-fold anticodon binding domain-containing protein
MSCSFFGHVNSGNCLPDPTRYPKFSDKEVLDLPQDIIDSIGKVGGCKNADSTSLNVVTIQKEGMKEATGMKEAAGKRKAEKANKIKELRHLDDNEVCNQCCHNATSIYLALKTS